MVAYNFQPMFIEPIRARTKCQTIRNPRAHGAMKGLGLQLYTGMRTRECMLIGLAICSAVVRVRIDLRFGRVEVGFLSITATGDLDVFAAADGFDDFADLRGFWAKHHPRVVQFEGELITWDPASFWNPATDRDPTSTEGQA